MCQSGGLSSVYISDAYRFVTQGEQVFQALLEAGRDRGITLKIAQNLPSRLSPNVDTQILAKKAHAQVGCLKFSL